MTTDESLVASGVDVCERHGYAVERPARSWLPTAIATPEDRSAPEDRTRPKERTTSEDRTTPSSRTADDGETVPFFGGEQGPGPIAVEPLSASDVEPATVISRLWNNSNNGRRSLFVVPGGDADALAGTVVGLLTSPACVADETDDGCRTFYNGPDRIKLAGGGYALHKAVDPDFQWFERPVEGDDADAGRAGTDSRQVVLADDDAEVAVLDGVDGLGCPPASTFPYSYQRNPRDKCFHVTDRSGHEVGVFTDIRSMRAAAYEPIPMPFVPEHLFDASVRSLWGVLVDDADGGRLYTADGRTEL